MKILISGWGSVGSRHFQNLLSLGNTDLVIHSTGMGVISRDDLQDYPVEKSIERALDIHQPEAVIVSNPSALHMDVAIPAAQAGCHLLIEKPLASNLDRIDELQEAVERGKGKLLVGYQYRFHPGLQLVQNLFADEKIGRPMSAQVVWGEYLPDWHPWEDYRQSYSAREDLGGGVLLTLSHPFDYLRWIFGDAVSVLAKTSQSSELGIEAESIADVLIQFDNGMQANVHLDYVRRPSQHSLVVVGTSGTVEWHATEATVRIWSQNSETWQSVGSDQGFERNDMFLAEMKHFLEVARGVADPFCTLDDGIAALQMALRAKSENKPLNEIREAR